MSHILYIPIQNLRKQLWRICRWGLGFIPQKKSWCRFTWETSSEEYGRILTLLSLSSTFICTDHGSSHVSEHTHTTTSSGFTSCRGRKTSPEEENRTG
nr:hypothetical protein Iba_chr09fCG3000 [Ipomoea batatas]